MWKNFEHISFVSSSYASLISWNEVGVSRSSSNLLLEAAINLIYNGDQNGWDSFVLWIIIICRVVDKSASDRADKFHCDVPC